MRVKSMKFITCKICNFSFIVKVEHTNVMRSEALHKKNVQKRSFN